MSKQLHDYQKRLVEFIKNTPKCALWLSMGLGKALDDEMTIPTPNGYKKIKDLKIGDLLFDKNGSICKITNIFIHKNKKAYKVTLKDNRSFICCDEHLIPFQSYTKAKTIQYKPLKEMFNDYVSIINEQHNWKRYKYRVPVAKAVNYKEKKHIIHPYVLGVLIGDGYLIKPPLTISSMDKDIIDKVAKLQNIKNVKKSNCNYNWIFSNDDNAKLITKEIKRLGLNILSKNKFIPKEYMLDSIENRKQLLIGLLDTDGHIHISHKNEKDANHSISYQFSTASEQLADDVCELAWSLGYGATKYTYTRLRSDKKQKHEIDYMVTISAEEQLVFTKRKIENIKFKFNTKRTKQNPIVNIEQVANRDMRCFTVDSDDSMFLIQDYTVTHNTAVTLHALKEMNPLNHILVVAPLNIARSTWIDEIEDWNLPFRWLSLIVNNKGKKLSKAKRYELYESLKDRPASICFINRELLPDLVEWSLNRKPAIWYFPYMVLDEAQGFKSYSSQRFKAVKKILPAVTNLIELSGTPMPHSLEDLWSQVYMLDNGARLGPNITTFREVFLRPTKFINGRAVNYEPLPGAEDEIYRRLSNITVSMKSDGLNLPELTINEIKVHMDETEKALYEELKKEKILKITEEEGVTAENAATLHIKLSQMASGAVYLDSDDVDIKEKKYALIHTKKLEMCEYIINDTDSPVMIAYHFKSDLDMLKNYLTDKGLTPTVFNGSPEMIKDWNNNKIKILLLQPKSAGHGLNLQKGDGRTLIWYTLPTSLEEYLQCNARLYRQGQKHNCVIHILMTAGTVDKLTYKRLQDNDASQESLLAAVKAAL